MTLSLLGYSEVATLLGIKPNTLYSMVHRNQIPHYRFGPRTVRFNEAELLDWLNAVRVVENSDTHGTREGSL